MSEDDLLSRPTVFREGLFAGKTVLVSGGGSGIGRTIAALFAQLGAELVICGRRPEKLEATAALLARTGGRCRAIPCDIRDPEAVDALFERVWRDCDHLDVLVNNAGDQFPMHSIDLSERGWRAVIDTNLNGTFTMMQRAARHWRDRGGPGNVVNIIAPFIRGMYGVAHTVASRGAVHALSRNLAVEWAPHGIRINCVMPGPIATRGLEVYSEQARAELVDGVPLGILGEAQDVAEAVVYLAGPSGRFVTGETVAVDGGHQLGGDLWLAGRPAGHGGEA